MLPMVLGGRRELRGSRYCHKLAINGHTWCCRFVIKGWLTAIMETFKLRPKAGMVGPLFMGRSNIVQVGAAGSCWLNIAGLIV